MDIVSNITQIIEPSLTALGYSLVQVKMADGKSKTLSIMAERLDDVMMSFDDCQQITNSVSAILDVEELISGAYSLEVCSPGIDRPLTKKDDYARFAGNEIKMETIIAVGGRKRFRGILTGINGDIITINMPEKAPSGATSNIVEIPFSYIRTAKLVMTNELVAEYLKKQDSEKKAIKKQKTKG